MKASAASIAIAAHFNTITISHSQQDQVSDQRAELGGSPGRQVCVKQRKANRLKHLRRSCEHHVTMRHRNDDTSGVDIQQRPDTLPPLLLSCCSSIHDHQCANYHRIAQNDAVRHVVMEQKSQARRAILRWNLAENRQQSYGNHVYKKWYKLMQG